MGATRRVGVIGSGAAAWAAILGLLRHPEARALEIQLFAPDEPGPPFPLRGRDPRTWTRRERDDLHRQLRRTGGWSVPPPRTQHGDVLERCLPDRRISVYRNRRFGGLGEFWSTAMFPYREEDLAGWPLDLATLRPWYAQVAAAVGIAGDPAAFSRLYPETFVNRPPVGRTRLAEALAEALARRDGERFHFEAGPNLLAVETRPDHPATCVYCGGCLYGCFKDALFRPSVGLRRWLAEDRLHWTPRGVRSARPAAGGVRLDLDDGSEARVDVALLCAGALGSSEIALRSLPEAPGEVIVRDNEMYNFPIVSLGWFGSNEKDVFPISSTAVTLRSRSDGGPIGHLLVAPLPALAFDFYLPARLADVLAPLTRFARARSLVGQMYVDGREPARYALSLDARGEPVLRGLAHGGSHAAAREQIRDLRRALGGSSLFVPPTPLLQVSSSYHYAGGFEYGGADLAPSDRGELLPGVFLCDSSAFPTSPAQPPTFTIMAHAMRVAFRALGAEDGDLA